MAWYDADTDTMTDTLEARGLFDPEAARAEVIHRPTPTGSGSEDLAMLQAAQFAGPRDTAKMLQDAAHIGKLMGQSAFYSFPAGNGRVEGPTIGLAYALAQIWGRCRTQVVIDEVEGDRIKLRGRYIDLLTVAITERDYVFHLAPAPGKFKSKPDQVERWRTMQEQSASSKAVRGAILGGLPTWFVDAAFHAAKSAAQSSALGDKPIEEVRPATVKAFAGRLTQAQLEQHIGRPVGLWVVDDIVALRQLYADLKNGVVALDAIKAELAGEQATTPAKNSKPQAYQQPQGQPANRMGSLGLQAPSAATAAPSTDVPAAPPEGDDQGDDGDNDAPAGSDPERDQLMARITQAEKLLGRKGVTGARGEAGLSPNPDASLKRCGLPKLQAYLQAMTHRLDEIELMGGEE